jgi:hypothetical protein
MPDAPIFWQVGGGSGPCFQDRSALAKVGGVASAACIRPWPGSKLAVAQHRVLSSTLDIVSVLFRCLPDDHRLITLTEPFPPWRDRETSGEGWGGTTPGRRYFGVNMSVCDVGRRVLDETTAHCARPIKLLVSIDCASLCCTACAECSSSVIEDFCTPCFFVHLYICMSALLHEHTNIA